MDSGVHSISQVRVSRAVRKHQSRKPARATEHNLLSADQVLGTIYLMLL